jgi:hypothetical protein
LIAKGENMASKEKIVREGQKTYWERKLNQRIEVLKGKEFETDKIEKDTVVKKIRAKIRETKSRLRTIDEKEKKIEEMARIREEKKAAPAKVKTKKEKPSEKAPAEAKSKKKKKKEEKKEKAEVESMETKKTADEEKAEEPEDKAKEEKKEVK